MSDFGIASKRMDGEQQMNHTVVGTTRYMSPERLKAKPYTCLSDMWSFGLLLLECATGYSPFHSITSIVSAFTKTHFFDKFFFSYIFLLVFHLG